MTSRPDAKVLDHPLVQHKLAGLRDRTTPPKVFKELVEEIAMLMAYEVTGDLPLDEVEVETPLERMRGRRVEERKLVFVPILRAGLGMVGGVVRLVPEARIGHVGLQRDEESLEPERYYFKMPEVEEGQRHVLLDPMLATGGTAAAAIRALKDWGAERIRFMCLVASPEGVERVGEEHPDVPLFAASIDRGLSDEGYVVPGLGDAGDRLFGTR